MGQEIVRIVMRNTITRKNAVYLISVLTTGPSRYRVVAHWGQFNLYDPANLSTLQSQIKADGVAVTGAQVTGHKLYSQKLDRGYALVAQASFGAQWFTVPMGLSYLSEEPAKTGYWSTTVAVSVGL